MGFDGIFAGLSISASGMRAQRVAQNIISSNLANAETTRTDAGGPYRRQFPVFQAQLEHVHQALHSKRVALNGVTTDAAHQQIPGQDFATDRSIYGRGVHVAEIREDAKPPKLVYDPAHPDADSSGYVALPNVNIVEEMTDMIAATRAYEANVTAFNAMKSMIQQALQI